jgi:hypothetical protein
VKWIGNFNANIYGWRFGLLSLSGDAPVDRSRPEHPRPHAQRGDSLPNPAQGKPINNRHVKTILEKQPWFESRWKEQLEKLPDSERDEMLFMLAPRWADDVRTQDSAQNRPPLRRRWVSHQAEKQIDISSGPALCLR